MSAASLSPNAVVGGKEPRSCNGSLRTLATFRAYILACVHTLQAGFLGKCASLCSTLAASRMSRASLAAGSSPSSSESAGASGTGTGSGSATPLAGDDEEAASAGVANSTLSIRLGRCHRDVMHALLPWN